MARFSPQVVFRFTGLPDELWNLVIGDHVQYCSISPTTEGEQTVATPIKRSDALAKALADALAEETRIAEKYGDEPIKDGAVIAYRVKFNPNGTAYRYAAIRAGGLWYTTGPRSPKGYTWDELTRWLDTQAWVSKIKVLRPTTAKEA